MNIGMWVVIEVAILVAIYFANKAATKNKK